MGWFPPTLARVLALAVATLLAIAQTEAFIVLATTLAIVLATALASFIHSSLVTAVALVLFGKEDIVSTVKSTAWYPTVERLR
jgi:hypothetical protein